MAGFLSKERIVASKKFNRWLIPPAALAIHLCIGMAYGFSVFWKPLGTILRDSQGKVLPLCAANANTFWTKILGSWQALFATDCNWSQFDLGWMFTLFFVFLGSSAAIWGDWLERVGPRKVGLISCFCWVGGFFLSALGIYIHQLWIMWLGSGVIGGIGLGLGYISPVSTLIKWFPDKRGMATGMAIMGFGGGALIGSPLATQLMAHFADSNGQGVWQTFIALGLIYTVFMVFGSLMYRIPEPGYKPAGWKPPVEKQDLVSKNHVHLKDAHKTKQFWLIWFVLFLNVTASIGIIGAASPMLQETFGGMLIHQNLSFEMVSQNPALKTMLGTIAAGFVGLISIFNIIGRIFWASSSDKLGRKLTYNIFFLGGALLYFSLIWFAKLSLLSEFIFAVCLIISMYGGGFSTVPAYLADIFGTQFVGAIHGRILTAWSTAGVFGPMIVNYLHDISVTNGVPYHQIYVGIFPYLIGILLLGFVANFMISPVDKKYHMSRNELNLLKKEIEITHHDEIEESVQKKNLYLIFSWLLVGIPLLIGIGINVLMLIKLLS
jgi:MFS family permease